MSNRIGNHVILRREWHRDGYGIWFCERDRNHNLSVAKPVKLEFESHGQAFQLPEPTLSLPGPAAKEFYEALTQELKYSGEAWLEAHTSAKRQEEHIKDLQKYLDRTFGLLERK